MKNNIMDCVFCNSGLIDTDSIDICDTFISDHCVLIVNTSIPVCFTKYHSKVTLWTYISNNGAERLIIRMIHRDVIITHHLSRTSLFSILDHSQTFIGAKSTWAP